MEAKIFLIQQVQRERCKLRFRPYLQVGNPASLGDIQNVVGIMFSSSNFLGMTNLMSALAVVGYERVVFYRERGASM